MTLLTLLTFQQHLCEPTRGDGVVVPPPEWTPASDSATGGA